MKIRPTWLATVLAVIDFYAFQCGWQVEAAAFAPLSYQIIMCLASLYHMLEISYFAGSAPYVDFSSPAGALATWDFLSTTVRGSVDFSNANVYGLDVEAVFA